MHRGRTTLGADLVMLPYHANPTGLDAARDRATAVAVAVVAAV